MYVLNLHVEAKQVALCPDTAWTMWESILARALQRVRNIDLCGQFPDESKILNHLHVQTPVGSHAGGVHMVVST